MLEEIEIPYEVHAVNIGKNEQFKPEYLAINPNNKIPAIIDTERARRQAVQACSSPARS